MHVVQSGVDFIEVYLHGKLSQQDLLDAQKSLMLHPDYSHKNSLWIFDKEFECLFSNEDFAELINRIKLFYPFGATKQKAALLGSMGIHFGILQLYCEEAEQADLPFRFRAFLSYSEAVAWLTGEQ
ncbi:MAG: hypothetical protein HGA60_08400 [Chlorobiaceae bacterium]|nr:hypothetical protein [Chlorobiaceae bacterium]